MAESGIDVLVLGRQDNAGYACGMRRLWTAGTRPFGAGCIVVRATGRVHALSSWAAGIEAPMSFEDLYPLTWNPRIMAASMAAIDGLAEAARIGVDELTPSFRRAAVNFAPAAEVAAVDDLMADVRLHKLPGEIEAIARACTAAWVGVEAALGAPERSDPAAAAIEAMAERGATVPSSGVRAERRGPGLAVDVGVICDLYERGATVPSSGVRAERRGPGLAVDVGVICDLYEGGAGGLFVDGQRAGPTALIDACRAGASHADLAAAASAEDWLVRGLGMGFERPVINRQLGLAGTLEAGMVLSVADGDHRDVVHVTAEGPAVLSEQP